MRYLKNFLYFLAIAAPVAATYFTTLKNEFVYDDHYFVEQNTALRSFAAIPRYFISAQATSASEGLNRDVYRPLTTLSFAIDWHIAGPNPAYFRSVNIFLHALAGYLLFLCGRMLGLSVLEGLAAALFFALFPTHVESVAWISGRSNMLAGIWILVSFMFFITYTRSQARVWLAACSTALVAGLLSKETAAVVPILLAAWCFVYGAGLRKYMKDIILYTVVPVVVYAIIRAAVLGQFAQASYPPAGLMRNLFTPLVLFAKYLEVLAYPFDAQVTFTTLIAKRLSHLWVFGASAAFISALYAFAAWALYRTGRKLASFSLLWIPITLAPVLNIIPLVFYMNERYLYVPLLGCGLIVGGIARFLNSRYKNIEALALILAILLVLFRYEIKDRGMIWQNDRVLWAFAVQHDQDDYLNHMKLALALAAHGDFDRAVSSMREAISKTRDPGMLSAAYNHLGDMQAAQGRYAEAEKSFNRALEYDPGSSASRKYLDDLKPFLKK